jgi:hypothetical protein
MIHALVCLLYASGVCEEPLLICCFPCCCPKPISKPFLYVLPSSQLWLSQGFGITVGDVKYDRAAVAKHAEQLSSNVAKNLGNSLTALGVDTIAEAGELAGPNQVKRAGTDKVRPGS